MGSGNGLVLSGSKPLSEPVSTWIDVAIWQYLVTNELNKINGFLTSHTPSNLYPYRVDISHWPGASKTASKATDFMVKFSDKFGLIWFEKFWKDN